MRKQMRTRTDQTASPNAVLHRGYGMASAPKTGSEFLNVLKTSQLLAPSILKHIMPQLESYGDRFDDADRLAKLLIRSDLITPYQARHLLQGRPYGFYFGKCKILDVLGKGGMGSVYLAEQITMHRLVAVKVVRRIMRSKSETFARFTREARAVASLKHTNIVQAHDFDQTDGTPYIVMEHVEGMSVNEQVEKLGAVPFQQAADYVVQAAAGLQHAHDNGLVHRDVKPANILIDIDGIVKLMDLGLCSSLLEQNRSDSLTTDDDRLGTVDYIAPEQAIDSKNADIRADIYSLGAVFYYMLSGQILYPDASTAQKLIYQQSTDPEPLSNLVDGTVPEELIDIVNKMLNRDPNQRFQLPKDVIGAVQKYAVRQTPPFDVNLIKHTRKSIGKFLRRSPALHTIQTTSSLPDDSGSTVAPTTTASLIASTTLDTDELSKVNQPSEVAVQKESASTEVPNEAPQTITAADAKSGWSSSSLSKITDHIPAPIRKSRLAQAAIAAAFAASVGLASGLFTNSTELAAEPVDDVPDVVVESNVEADTTPDVAPTATNGTTNDENATTATVPEDANTDSLSASSESKLKSGFDNLKQEDISSVEFANATSVAEPGALDGLVAVIGDSRLKHWARIKGLATFDGGSKLVSMGQDSCIKTWELASGNQINSVYLPNAGMLQGFALAPNKKTVAISDDVGIIRIFDLESLQELHQLKAPTSVTSIHYSLNGNTLYAAIGKKGIRRFNLITGVTLEDKKFAHPVTKIVSSPNGQLLGLLGGKGLITVWNHSEERIVSDFDMACNVKDAGLQFTPDGKSLMAFFPNPKKIVVFDLESNAIRFQVNRDRWVNSAWLSLDGKKILLAQNTKVFELDLANGTVGSEPIFNTASPTLCVGWIDDNRMAVGTKDHQIEIWDVSERRSEFANGAQNYYVRAVEIDSNLDSLLHADRNTIQKFDLNSQQSSMTKKIGRGKIAKLLLSKDGNNYFTCNTSGAAIALNEVNGTGRLQLEYDDQVTNAIFNPDSSEVAIAIQFDGVHIHDVSNGTMRVKLAYSTDDAPHNCLAYDAQGSLVAGGGFAAIAIWNSYTGKLMKTLRPESDTIVPDYTSISFLYGGKRLISTDSDGSITLWDIETGKVLLRQTYDGGDIGAFAISQTHVAVAGTTGEIAIWSLDSLESPAAKTLKIAPKSGLVQQLHFGPNGRHIVTVNSNGLAYILRLNL